MAANSINSYPVFVKAIQSALESNQNRLVLHFNYYNQSTYNFSRALGQVLRDKPELQMKYKGAYQQVSILGSKATMTISFSYAEASSSGRVKEINNYNQFYNALKASLYNFDQQLILKINNYNSNTYNTAKTIEKILAENPDLDYGYQGVYATILGTGSKKIIKESFSYAFSKNSMVKMRALVDQRARAVVTQLIKPGMTHYQKELIIHDYLVSHAKYNQGWGDIPKEDYTPYGVLVKGSGVCSSYAKATQKLLRMAGVPCWLVTGRANGQDHAWDIVKIGGHYYHLDTTWDDPVTNTGQNVLRHTYFNVTDSRMIRDHQWDRSKYPPCLSTVYSYKNIKNGGR